MTTRNQNLTIVTAPIYTSDKGVRWQTIEAIGGPKFNPVKIGEFKIAFTEEGIDQAMELIGAKLSELHEGPKKHRTGKVSAAYHAPAKIWLRGQDPAAMHEAQQALNEAVFDCIERETGAPAPVDPVRVATASTETPAATIDAKTRPWYDQVTANTLREALRSEGHTVNNDRGRMNKPALAAKLINVGLEYLVSFDSAPVDPAPVDPAPVDPAPVSNAIATSDADTVAAARSLLSAGCTLSDVLRLLPDGRLDLVAAITAGRSVHS